MSILAPPLRAADSILQRPLTDLPLGEGGPNEAAPFGYDSVSRTPGLSEFAGPVLGFAEELVAALFGSARAGTPSMGDGLAARLFGAIGRLFSGLAQAFGAAPIPAPTNRRPEVLF